MLKKLIWISGVLAVIVIILVILAGRTISKSSEAYVFDNLKQVPHQKVGLLLGTGKFLNSGQPNRYFTYRIEAALALYKAMKIDYIVISGDNSQKDYNEPEDMKNELVRMGVPAEKIFLDYAGFRTFDSVVRIDKIFGQQSFTVISQEFHNQRAVYIANRLGLHAIAYNARDVDRYNGFKTKLREKLARVKVFIDFIIGTNPKYLGEQVIIKG
jgi:SanA protein